MFWLVASLLTDGTVLLLLYIIRLVAAYEEWCLSAKLQPSSCACNCHQPHSVLFLCQNPYTTCPACQVLNLKQISRIPWNTACFKDVQTLISLLRPTTSMKASPAQTILHSLTNPYTFALGESVRIYLSKRSSFISKGHVLANSVRLFVADSLLPMWTNYKRPYINPP